MRRQRHEHRNAEAKPAVKSPTAFLLIFVVTFIFLSALSTPSAYANNTICSLGSGAGQCDFPTKIAVDTAAKRLYVADRGNNRIDVFDAETGAFIKAFGFGVKTGADTFQVCETSCRAGIADGDAQPGQFENVTGITVDNNPGSPSFHDVYVGELGDESQRPRVQKLDPLVGVEEKGVEFLWMLGSGVNKTVPGDLCTAASGHTCGAGAKSEVEGGFSQAAASGAGILTRVGPDGSLYVVDSLGLEKAPKKARLQRFEDSGAQISPQRILFEPEFAYDFAIVPTTGDLWVVTGNTLRRFEVDGSQKELISVSNGSTPSLAVAIGPGGRLFIGNGNSESARIIELEDSGSATVPSRVFGYGQIDRFNGNVGGLALPPSPSESSIFVSESWGTEFDSGSVLRLDFPVPGPLIYPEACKASPLGNSKGTLTARINPEGEPTKYHFELVTDAEFEDEGFDSPTRVPAQASEDPTVSSQPGQLFPLFELEKAALETKSLIPETDYHCRVVAENIDGEAIGQEGAFKSLPPLEIGSTWSSEVGAEEATLNAEVNPLGIETTAYFEYVDEATYQKDIAELGAGHGFDHALEAPDVDGEEDPIELGAGESFKAISATIEGLSPGTAYRYRIVATDLLISPDPPPNEVFGPTKSLRTYQPGEGELPDGRAYELVSPAQKNGAEVGVQVVAGGLYLPEKLPRIQTAASSGEAVTYTSWTSFGKPESAPSASQYLSKRTTGGWQTENVSPFGFLTNPLEPPYFGFAPDLSTSAFIVDQPTLTEDAQEGFRNLYVRDNGTGAIQALTSEEPQFTPTSEQGLDKFCVSYGGASADGKRTFFTANGAMAEALPGIGFSLYEWSASEGLKLISVLPSEEPAKPALLSGFGAGHSICSMAQHVIANAVSEDGSTVFWTYGGKYLGAERPLFARLSGAQTIQLDAKASGASGPSGNGVFWAAAPDGSEAFFTAPGRLTKDAGAAGHLYSYDFEQPEGEQLTDLTPGPIVPQIKGVIGASEEGDYVYFVASGALTGEEQGPSGQKAQQGANNLYLWHEGEGPRFIARLAEADEKAWSPSPERLSARLTPDGRSLAFLSVESQALSGYDNRIFPGAHCGPQYGSDELSPNAGPACPQAYLYDAEEDSLTCASCNPSGSRPQGPTELPGWTNAFEGSRYLSEDGSTLFFESRDALLAADENGKRDVYEFEREGSGSCDSENPNFNPESGGCIFLISSGQSEDGSFLLDASADGRDVFFSTRRQLVGWDDNGNYDVYDAREGGGFPEPPPPTPICEGEGCKGASSAPPALAPSPGSASFQGPGNPVKPGRPRCRKGTVRRGGRCRKVRQRGGRGKTNRDGRGR